MERNTVTTIDKLQIGDRFYVVADKHRLVYEKVDHKAHRTNYQTYRHWCIMASIIDVSGYNEKIISRHAKPLKASTPLVFLRNKTLAND